MPTLKSCLSPLFLILSLSLSGCVSSKGGDVYSRDEARRTATVRMGTVESIRVVKLEGTKSPVGPASGAVIGGIAGSSVANDTKGQAIGAVIGAVVGGIAGGMLEERMTREDALEITVRTDDGKMVAVIQVGEPGEFKAGDSVRLMTTGGETRVSR